MLVERGPERQRAEAHPGQVVAGQPLGQLVAVDEGRADDLERPGGPPPLRHVGPLDQAQPRVDEGGVDGGHVGRRQHPGQAGGLEGVARAASRAWAPPPARSRAGWRSVRRPRACPPCTSRAISPMVRPWRTGIEPSPTNDSASGLDLAALDLHAAQRVRADPAPPPARPPGPRPAWPAPWSRRRCSSGCRRPAGRPAARRCPPASRGGGDSDSKVAPYRLVTGMPGAAHRARRRRRSCPAPRRARRARARTAGSGRMPAAISRSTTWVRSGVTLAGWHSTPTRRPRHRASRSATRTSIPGTTAHVAPSTSHARPAGQAALSRSRMARNTTSSPRETSWKRTMRQLHFCLSPASASRSLAMNAGTLSPSDGLPRLRSALRYSLYRRG